MHLLDVSKKKKATRIRVYCCNTRKSKKTSTIPKLCGPLLETRSEAVQLYIRRIHFALSLCVSEGMRRGYVTVRYPVTTGPLLHLYRHLFECQLQTERLLRRESRICISIPKLLTFELALSHHPVPL